MKGLLDLDSAIYACAFIAQHERHVIWSEHGTPLIDFQVKKKENQLYQAIDSEKKIIHEGKKKGECLEAILLKYEGDHESYLEVEPVDHAIHALKTFHQGVFRDAKADQYLTAMSGKLNFRNDIATYKKYKGNRDKIPKPVHFEALREYARKYLNITETEGIEPDDLISIVQNTDPSGSIGMTIDKDFMQIPGHKYYWDKKVLKDKKPNTDKCFLYVTPLIGLEHFYLQLMTGDRTDNIEGLSGTKENPGYGPTAAKKVIKKFEGDFKGLQEHILNLYEVKFGCVPEYDNWKGEHLIVTPEDIMTEMGQLLWMQRYGGELWTLDTLDEMLELYPELQKS